MTKMAWRTPQSLCEIGYGGARYPALPIGPRWRAKSVTISRVSKSTASERSTRGDARDVKRLNALSMSGHLAGCSQAAGDGVDG
jgi:hypothetical protein